MPPADAATRSTCQICFRRSISNYYRTLRRKGCAYVRDDRALLIKIASRRAMRYYTLKQRMRLLVPIQAAGENGNVTDTDIPDPFSLEDAVITAEESGNIAREISHLPAETRKIIVLRRGYEASGNRRGDEHEAVNRQDKALPRRE